MLFRLIFNYFTTFFNQINICVGKYYAVVAFCLHKLSIHYCVNFKIKCSLKAYMFISTVKNSLDCQKLSQLF